MKKVLKPYKNLKEIRYWSPRYGRLVVVPIGFLSDGATGAIDVKGSHPVFDVTTGDVVFVSQSWLVHDMLCEDGYWFDGTKLSNWQCSMVLKDILKSEGRWVRDFWWMLITLSFGGGKARDNGIFSVESQ